MLRADTAHVKRIAQHESQSSNRRQLQVWASSVNASQRGLIMKTILHTALAFGILVTLVSTAVAGNLPDAPSSVMLGSNNMIVTGVPHIKPAPLGSEKRKVVDKKFLTLAAFSTASTFADSFTTLWATDNWKHGKTGVCNIERQTPWLYGRHPSAGRAFGVAAIKSAGTIVSSYYMKKRHRKFWSVPLVINTGFSMQGMIQNIAACN